MSWLDIAAVVGGVAVSAVLVLVLDPSLVRGWLSRLGGNGRQGL